MDIKLFNGSYGENLFSLKKDVVIENYKTFNPSLYPSINTAEKIINYKIGCDSLSLILPPLKDVISNSVDIELVSEIKDSCKGIYFLIEDDNIKYVGKAIDLKVRINNHIKSTSSVNRFAQRFSLINLQWSEDILIREIESNYIFSVKSDRNRTVPSHKRFATLEQLIDRIGCQIDVIWWFINDRKITGLEMENYKVYDMMKFVDLCYMIRPFKLIERKRITISKILTYWNGITNPTDFVNNLPF